MRHICIIQPLIPKYRIPLFNALAANSDFDLTVVADLKVETQLNQIDNAAEIKFNTIHVPEKVFGGLVFRPGLVNILKKHDFDAVIFSGGNRNISELLALYRLRYRGIPCGVWGMFFSVKGKARNLATSIVSRLYGAADVLFGYGVKSKSALIKAGVNPPKIVVLHNAIDQKPICNIRNSISSENFRQFVDKEGLLGLKIILHVVRLTDIKRPELTIQAFEKICQKRDDVCLVMIGGGPLEAAMKALAERIGVLPRCRFLGPIYDEKILAYWFKVASVFTCASCIGLSVHHAMCYGVPVVTDNNEVTQTAEFEVVVDGVNGLLYNYGDIDDFAKKLLRIIYDDSLRANLSKNAIMRIEKEYTLERMTDNFCRGIKRLFVMCP